MMIRRTGVIIIIMTKFKKTMMIKDNEDHHSDVYCNDNYSKSNSSNSHDRNHYQHNKTLS